MRAFLRNQKKLTSVIGLIALLFAALQAWSLTAPTRGRLTARFDSNRGHYILLTLAWSLLNVVKSLACRKNGMSSSFVLWPVTLCPKIWFLTFVTITRSWMLPLDASSETMCIRSAQMRHTKSQATNPGSLLVGTWPTSRIGQTLAF
jgi:hypothetical protein